MKLSIQQQDAEWLRRQLRINLRCVVCIFALLVIIRWQPNPPIMSTRASSPNDATRLDVDFDVPSAELAPLPADSEISPATGRKPNPIPPSGWRRTSRGWEHVSTWPNQTSIGELVEIQKNNEPAWIQSVFAKLRGIPPLWVALLQVTGVAVIIGIANDRRKNA